MALHANWVADCGTLVRLRLASACLSEVAACLRLLAAIFLLRRWDETLLVEEDVVVQDIAVDNVVVGSMEGCSEMEVRWQERT